jgi:hypothetical protein
MAKTSSAFQFVKKLVKNFANKIIFSLLLLKILQTKLFFCFAIIKNFDNNFKYDIIFLGD